MSADVNALERVVAFLGKRTSEAPRGYGAFHIVSLCIILAFSALAVLMRRRLNENFLAYAMLWFGIIMTVLEIYKQIEMSYNPATDTWKYSWHIFPFQFCSTPIYFTFIAFVLYKLQKTDAFRAVTAFLGTYSLIAAVVVLFVGTDTVFSRIIGVNIQTMVHHGLMFILAVMILASGTVSYTVKTAAEIFKIFAVLVVMALGMNKIFGDGTSFDMFFLSPDSTFVYPAVKELFGGHFPHYLYVIGYILFFTLGAFLILGVGYAVTERLNKGSETQN